jgi:hypothetical protein
MKVYGKKMVGPSLALFAVAAGAAMFAAGNARGDPYPWQILKFDQQPLNNVNIGGAVYNGTDEASWASLNSSGGFSGPGVADDFADLYNTPVVHVSWWGSYLSTTTAPTPVPSFQLTFESDVPASPTNSFSHPGSVLLTQTLTRSTSTGFLPPPDQFTEQLVTGTSNLYKYNGELSIPFPEQANTVYWLKIVALLNPNSTSTWGWHNRNYTLQDTLASTPPAVSPGEYNAAPATSPFPVWSFQDDAVTSAFSYFPANGVVEESSFTPLFYHDTVDGPTGISSFSEDMAYQLYTPEPATLGLLAAGGLGLLLKRKRMRSA